MLKEIIILKNKKIKNVLQKNSHRRCLFSLGCPNNFKTFKIDADINITTTDDNGLFINGNPDVYIAKVYPNILKIKDPTPIHEFKFHIGETINIDKEIKDGHTIMVFGDYNDEYNKKLFIIEINIDKITVGIEV